MTARPIQLLRCPGCGKQLVPEDYLCSICGFCQYCCMCSAETNPESTLAGD